ncbi:MAG: adventurous gliding motility protein CglE [Myxococcota bacterium]
MHQTLFVRLSTAAVSAATVFALVSVAPSLARAQESIDAAPIDEESDTDSEPAPAAPPPPEVERAADTPAELLSIVRGFYIEARVGGGSAVTSGDIPEDPNFPLLNGQSENLGAGAQMGFHVGYDINDLLAVELVTGAAFVSGRRTDRVRDVGMFYGGPGVRLGFELERRLNFTVAGAATFVRADNGVDSPDSGPGVLIGTGLEYFVHVRHFSIGLDLSVLAPFSPARVFVALSPRLKYTF